MASTSKVFPGFENIHALGDPFSRRYYRADTDLEGHPSFHTIGVLRGDWHPPRPVMLQHSTGSATPGEVIWTTDVFPLVVNQRVIDLLEAHHFTGWRTYPVLVHNKAKTVVPGYHGLAIVGRCGPLDASRSRVVWRDFPGMLEEERIGYHFDEASWDGSDLFCSTDGKGSTLCTHAVKRALGRAKVRNLMFEPITELRIYDEALLATLPPLAQIPKLPGPKKPG